MTWQGLLSLSHMHCSVVVVGENQEIASLRTLGIELYAILDWCFEYS